MRGMLWRRLRGFVMFEKTPLRELIIPEEVLEASNRQEFIRFWVADGIDHTSMNIGGFVDNNDEARLWGSILADIAWHAVNGMQQKDPTRGTKKQMFNDILNGYTKRLKSKPSLEGKVGGK